MRVGIELLILAASVPGGLAGQTILDEFSYEGLRLSAIGVEIGALGSDRTTTEVSGGVRVDYGYFAPRIRVVVGANYFKGELAPDEIARFETRLANVVDDPTNDATISVGQITWANFEAILDLHYLFPAGRRVVTYLGLGLGVHVRDAAGAAINGSFVEDALDTIAAGVDGAVGAEVRLVGRWVFTAEARGGLTSELRTASARAGFAYRWQPWGLVP